MSASTQAATPTAEQEALNEAVSVNDGAQKVAALHRSQARQAASAAAAAKAAAWVSEVELADATQKLAEAKAASVAANAKADAAEATAKAIDVVADKAEVTATAAKTAVATAEAALKKPTEPAPAKDADATTAAPKAAK